MEAVELPEDPHEGNMEAQPVQVHPASVLLLQALCVVLFAIALV